MPDRVLIPLPGIGTLSLTRSEYESALIPIKATSAINPEPSREPLQPQQTEHLQTRKKQPSEGSRGLRCIRLREAVHEWDYDLRPFTTWTQLVLKHHYPENRLRDPVVPPRP